MKHRILIALLMCAAWSVDAQQYSFTFKLTDSNDSVMYIARHFRDELQVIDTAYRGKDGSFQFKGNRKWDRGIYALVGQDGKKSINDFAVDGSLKFTISGDSRLSPKSVKVKGCHANEQMFNYIATIQDANTEMKGIRERLKNPETKAAAEKEEEALNKRMEAFEEEALHPKKPILFFDLVNMFVNPRVPDSIKDKNTYFRMHYWDGVNFKDHSLIYTPNMFNKMNYFFFGVLYNAESDTICKDLDRLMERMDGDATMMEYVLEFITPKYFRATKNIGWDAVWCHIASEYYLKGRCPWATEGTLHNTRYNYNKIKQSLIGAQGQELWMADTNQSEDPKDWISSHRFPEKYVILWFWDPDCHHCQEQSEQLKVLYDSLKTAPNRWFEVYAVGFESDVPKWKKYVRDHKFPFVNVGGTMVNIDYQEAYNVHGAPTMIILNEKREIIMNKLLPVKSLIPFLQDYEKRQAAKKN